MKFSPFFLPTLLLSSIPFCANAASFGMCHYENQKSQNIQCFGSADMVNTTVENATSVFGPFSAKDSHLNTLDVKGVAQVDHSTVKGQTDIKGPLKANNSQFESDVEVYSNLAELNNTKIKTKIIIHCQSQTPEANLTNHSQIKEIIFSEKAGIVHLKKGEQTPEVKNGKLIVE